MEYVVLCSNHLGTSKSKVAICPERFVGFAESGHNGRIDARLVPMDVVDEMPGSGLGQPGSEMFDLSLHL